MMWPTTLPTTPTLHAPNRFRHLAGGLVLAVAACLATGCATGPKTPIDLAALMTPERLDCGYLLLLPGIGGHCPTDHELLVEMARADLPVAVEMYDWTVGPNHMLENLRGLEHNRAEAGKIAARIVAYQNAYPGRPVHVVGYSGGTGIAVMTLEALPPHRKVTSAILLAAVLAPNYDLRQAMGHTEQGIHNFYSSLDVPILMGAIAAVGTMEGRHTVAAGAWGFTVPKKLDAQDRELYEQRLIQQNISMGMLASGHTGGHYGWLEPGFLNDWIVPLVTPPTASDYQTVSFAPHDPAR